MRVTKRARLGAVAVAVAAAALGVSAVRADPPPRLPAVAPDALVASTLRALASPPTLSGTVRTHIDIGLPALPDVPSGGSIGGSGASIASALLGDQTYRVWRSTDGVRLAHLAQYEEQVLVVNRDEAWGWDSRSLSAVRLTPRGLDSLVPSGLVDDVGDDGSGPALPRTLGDPLAVARVALRAIRPAAVVSTATPERVAGRDAYVLDARPRADRTLVGSIRLAIDAVTHVPLRVQVVPRNTVDAAIDVGFTSISYEPIDPAIFSFRPPPGATVTNAAPLLAGAERSLHREASRARARFERLPASPDTWMPDVRVFGRGFGIIVAVRVSPVPEEVRSVLPYAGPLASAALVDRGSHGWIVAGLVRPEALARVQPKLP